MVLVESTNDPDLKADQFAGVRSEPRAEMNVRYPVDAVGQVIAAAASVDDELASKSPDHDIDVAGETRVTEPPS
jgi:hypothetical protein